MYFLQVNPPQPCNTPPTRPSLSVVVSGTHHLDCLVLQLQKLSHRTSSVMTGCATRLELGQRDDRYQHSRPEMGHAVVIGRGDGHLNLNSFSLINIAPIAAGRSLHWQQLETSRQSSADRQT